MKAEGLFNTFLGSMLPQYMDLSVSFVSFVSFVKKIFFDETNERNETNGQIHILRQHAA